MTDARDLVRDLVRDDVFDLVRCVQCGGHGMAYGIRAHMMDPVRYPGPGECSDAPCRLQSGAGHLVQYHSQSVRHVLGTRVTVRNPELHVGSNARSEIPHGVRNHMRRSKRACRLSPCL